MYYYIDPIIYPVPSHPRRVLHTFTIVNVMPACSSGWKNNRFDPFYYMLLKECVDNVNGTFGEDHAVAKEVRKTWTEAGFAESQGGTNEFIDDIKGEREIIVSTCRKKFGGEGS
jgi:hypothetical protein